MKILCKVLSALFVDARHPWSSGHMCFLAQPNAPKIWTQNSASAMPLWQALLSHYSFPGGPGTQVIDYLPSNTIVFVMVT